MANDTSQIIVGSRNVSLMAANEGIWSASHFNVNHVSLMAVLEECALNCERNVGQI